MNMRLRFLYILAAMLIVGAALPSRGEEGGAASQTQSVADSDFKKNYNSPENIKQREAIARVKEEINESRRKTPESAPLESSADVSDEKTAVPPSSKGSTAFGPGVTKVSPKDSPLSLGISPFKMLLGVLIVLGAMFGFFMVLKKFSAKLTGTENNVSLRVKARLQLDPKNSVVLLGAYEQEFLLGVGSNGVTLVSKFAPLEDAEDDDGSGSGVVEKADSVNLTFKDSLLKMAGVRVNSEELKSMGKTK